MMCAATHDLDRVMLVEINAWFHQAVAVKISTMAVLACARVGRSSSQHNRRYKRGGDG